MLRQTAAFLLIRAENLPGIIMVSALLCGYFLDHLRGFYIANRRKQNGGKMSTVYKRRVATAELGGRL